MGQGLLLPVVGIVSAGVAALLYAYVNVYSPVVGYVSVLFVGLLAAGAALPVAYAARWLKCRNPVMLRINAVATGLLTLYLAWACFMHVLLARFDTSGQVPSLMTVVAEPGRLWGAIQNLNETGWFSLGSGETNVTGTVLWVMWGIEAVIVVGVAYLCSTLFINRLAFCESCSSWCRHDPRDDLVVPVIPGRMVKDVRTGGLQALQEVPPPDTETSRFLNIYRQMCPQCKSFGVFGVTQSHLTVTKRNEARVTAEQVIPASVIRPEDAAAIERIRGELKAARARQFEAVKQAARPPVEPPADAPAADRPAAGEASPDGGS